MQNNTPEWEIVSGNIPLLLVAGHNFPHLRDGKIKARDVGTGLLAQHIAKSTGAWVISTANIQVDPNWHKDAPFREAVKSLIVSQKIKYVLDIHGRREGYPYLLEYSPNTIFEAAFFDLLKDGKHRPFTNTGKITLSQDLEGLNVPCLQIEIRRDGREPGTPQNVFVTKAISELISNLADSIN